MNFQAAIPGHLLQDGADGRVLNFADVAAGLVLRVDDPVAMFEEGGQITGAEVAVFVDAGGEDRAAVFQVPGGVVGASAEKGYAEGGAGDDHVVGRVCIAAEKLGKEQSALSYRIVSSSRLPQAPCAACLPQMRILAIQLNQPGDAILTTPALRWLMNQGHEVHALLQPLGAELLRTMPGLE